MHMSTGILFLPFCASHAYRVLPLFWLDGMAPAADAMRAPVTTTFPAAWRMPVRCRHVLAGVNALAVAAVWWITGTVRLLPPRTW